jgi:hypothetical protein
MLTRKLPWLCFLVNSAADARTHRLRSDDIGYAEEAVGAGVRSRAGRASATEPAGSLRCRIRNFIHALADGCKMRPVQTEASVLPFYLVLASVLVLSILSDAAAVALAFRHAHLDACRRRTVDRLTQIAFISAASIVALLYAFYPG